MSDFSKGYGTTIGHGTVGGSSFTKFARVTDIKPPKATVDSIDVSHLESPEMWKEKTAGWKEGGEASFTIQFKKDATAAVYLLLAVDKSFQITFSDGSTLDFDGFVSGIDPAVDKDGIVTAEMTITTSGKVEFVAAVVAP